jgi:DNA-directed RNA polymerase specialized sigma24 family protein
MDKKHNLLDLIRRAGTGDRDALGHLYVHYRRLLAMVVRYHLTRVALRVYDPSDVVNTVWQRLMETPWNDKTFETVADFRRWLECFARHKTQDVKCHCKTLKRDANREVPLVDEVAQAGRTAEQHMEDRDECAYLFAAATKQEQEVYHLFGQGRTQVDVVGMLNVTAYRVGVIRGNARDRLVGVPAL